MEQHSRIKRNELVIHATTWLNLKRIMLKEKKSNVKSMCQMMSFMRNSRKCRSIEIESWTVIGRNEDSWWLPVNRSLSLWFWIPQIKKGERRKSRGQLTLPPTSLETKAVCFCSFSTVGSDLSDCGLKDTYAWANGESWMTLWTQQRDSQEAFITNAYTALRSNDRIYWPINFVVVINKWSEYSKEKHCFLLPQTSVHQSYHK